MPINAFSRAKTLPDRRVRQILTDVTAIFKSISHTLKK